MQQVTTSCSALCSQTPRNTVPGLGLTLARGASFETPCSIWCSAAGLVPAAELSGLPRELGAEHSGYSRAPGASERFRSCPKRRHGIRLVGSSRGGNASPLASRVHQSTRPREHEKKMMRLSVRFGSLSVVPLALWMVGCGPADAGEPEPEPALDTTAAELSPGAATFPATFARQWMTNIAFSVKMDGISPPVASRSYAYGAITAYESVVHGMAGYQSLAGQLNGLDSLPQPVAGQTYDWPTVMAAAMGRVVPATFVFPNQLFFEFTTNTRVALGSLERVQIAKRSVSGVPSEVIAASTDFGHALGDAIAQWANADGYAEARYLGYLPPSGPSAWVATGYIDDQTARPLEPHFGELRTLALGSVEDCVAPPPVPFSTDPASAMYAQANAVYQTDLALTKAQRQNALYWADPPGATETPPGHWVKIVNDLIRPGNLADAVKAYAPVGITMFDAAIATWNAKYDYNLLRPETYIHRHISPVWRSLLPQPQFPSYTSGHSGFSAAAATALTTVYGNVPFTDRTKVRGGFGSAELSELHGRGRRSRGFTPARRYPLSDGQRGGHRTRRMRRPGIQRSRRASPVVRSSNAKAPRVTSRLSPSPPASPEVVAHGFCADRDLIVPRTVPIRHAHHRFGIRVAQVFDAAIAFATRPLASQFDMHWPPVIPPLMHCAPAPQSTSKRHARCRPRGHDIGWQRGMACRRAAAQSASLQAWPTTGRAERPRAVTRSERARRRRAGAAVVIARAVGVALARLQWPGSLAPSGSRQTAPAPHVASS